MFRKSFYQYLMTERNPDSSEPLAQFANNAFFDQSFPKQSQDYQEISNYLELNAGYLPSMLIFDQAWERYLEKMQ